MDRVSININRPISKEKDLGPITTFNAVNSGSELCFIINQDISIKEGDFLTFKKNTYTTDEQQICSLCHKDLKVLSSYTESGKTIVFTPNFENDVLTLSGGFFDEENLPYIIRYNDLVRIDFSQKHNITVVDLLKRKIKLIAYNSGETYTISELSACSQTNLNPLIGYEEKHSAFNEKLDSFYIKESDFNAISGGTYEFKVSEPIYYYNKINPNLFLGTNVEYTNNNYLVHEYLFAGNKNIGLIPGQTYTLSICVTVGDDAEAIQPYVSQGYTPLCNYLYTTPNKKQILTATFVMPNYHEGKTPSDNPYCSNFQIYRMPNTATANTTIHWAKVEEGNESTGYAIAESEGFIGENVLREDCQLTVGDGFYNLNIGLEQDVDYKKLYQEEKLTDIFLESKKGTVIPEPINMEKVKYFPFVVSGTESYMANEIEFNFHFRDRHNCLKYTSGISVTEAVKLNAAYKESVPTEVSTGSPKYIYIKREDDDAKVYYGLTYDGWVIDDNGGWNNIDSSAEYSEMKKILNQSDLLGYLGFADEEVKGQKNTVKKSFVRLLFYDSNDPVGQNLLSYSTIFFDAGELYGKYMKMNAVVGDSYYIKEDKGPQWVFYNGQLEVKDKLDSKIEIYNEYNTGKSSEGFYLYLFEDDAPIVPAKYSRWGETTLPTGCTDGDAFLLSVSGICINETQSFDSETKFARKDDFIIARTNDKGVVCWEVLPSSKDIYMKVEFNHAKYGRTLPMLMWPKGVSADGLTLNEYFKSLYIRVNLHRVGNKYVYTIPDIENDMVNGKITISLFEPKLKIEDGND